VNAMPDRFAPLRRSVSTGAWQPSPLRGLIALLVFTVPIFAHGCHGDDVDHEPAAVPLSRDASTHP